MTTSTPQQIRARSSWNLAQAHIQEGELREALPHLNTCIELAQDQDDHPLTLTVLLSAAQCTHLLGDSEKALTYLANAEKLATATAFLDGIARVELERSRILWADPSRRADAIELARHATVWAERANNPPLQCATLLEYSQRLLENNQLASCASQAAKVFTIASEHPDHAESPLFRVLSAVMETRAFLRLGMIEEAHHACSQGLDDAETFGGDIFASLTFHAVQIARLQGRPQDALRLLRSLQGQLVASGQTTPPNVLLEVSQVAQALQDSALQQRADTQLQEALQNDSSPSSRSILLRLQAHEAFHAGKLDIALKALQEAGTLAQELGHIPAVIECFKGIGLILERDGQHDEAIAMLTRSAQLCSELPDFQRQCAVMYEIGRIHIGRAKWQEAIATLREVEALQGRLQLRTDRAQSLHALGIALARLGFSSEADSAQSLAHQFADPANTAFLHQIMFERACLKRTSGDHQGALQALREALQTLRTQDGSLSLQGRCHAQIGDTLRTLKEYDEALDALNTANTLLREHGPHALRAMVAHWRGRILLERKDTEAIAALSEAVDLYTAHGADPATLELFKQNLQRAHTQLQTPTT